MMYQTVKQANKELTDKSVYGDTIIAGIFGEFGKWAVFCQTKICQMHSSNVNLFIANNKTNSPNFSLNIVLWLLWICQSFLLLTFPVLCTYVRMNCIHSGTITDYCQTGLKLKQNYSTIMVKLLITKQGDFWTSFWKLTKLSVAI